MNGIQNGGPHNLEEPLPGCFGKMDNLFDLTAGMPGNQLLTEKPYRDGSSLSRSCSDVSGISPTQDLLEDTEIISKTRRTSLNKKSRRTPIKMLIAEEMSKEMISTESPTNVVARLMGLDAISCQQPHSASQRSHSRNSSYSNVPMEYCQQVHDSFETQKLHEIHPYPVHNNFKDVYEIWQSHDICVKDKSSQRERFSGSASEKKMALIRQKFADLKRLASDEKLRQTKQFQDALEVLSSNNDLFLRFLQEPNSMFSKQLCDLHTIAPSPSTKRITVLRPAKMVDGNKFTGLQKQFQVKKTSQTEQVRSRDKRTCGFSSPTNCKAEDSHIQTTRIVVLKPSLAKSRDLKTVVLPHSSFPSALSTKDDQGEHENNDARESSVGKEITRKVCENFGGHSRDGTLRAPMLSNGYSYMGDGKSFHSSENEYAVENLSDPELMSQASRHSWDYKNRSDSPYSLSFNRASYSPESSVCREAKKRLSERWTMMAASGNCQEKGHMRKSSSTLGDMLAISDMKKLLRPEGDSSHKQEARASTSCLCTNLSDNDSCNATARNFLRSKSLPVSSTIDGSRLGLEVSNPKMEKNEIMKEVPKARAVKLKLKQRVSSLFFSRHKKYGKEESSQPSSVSDHGCNPSTEAPEHSNDIASSSKVPSLDLSSMEPILETSPTKAVFSVLKSSANENFNENQEQPSPISVLEPSFDENDHGIPEFYNNLKPVGNGTRECSSHLTKSNLIDKSPPIGSIARTLSWDDSCTETTTPFSMNMTAFPICADKERQEWFFLVQTLLSAAGFDNVEQPDTHFPRWHSHDSPLDLSLRDQYLDLNDKEVQHEAKLRQRRSIQKLVFDCVNAALKNLAVYESTTGKKGVSCNRSNASLKDHASSTMVEIVWSQIEEWFSDEMKCVPGYFGDNRLVVEMVARKEVAGKGWLEHLAVDMEDLRKEIENKLLEELVQEAVEDLTVLL
ncbi:hypothetical protein DCAR_0314303 [Daucus carota subsp. sativus]|uniref:DUF4378 domain-containing protein n=1 Tax=Daucus carota subsp. sativus TaxID=79200 RepID=A0AAF0WTV9_DAUCS|nr:PREDICTED: uncharacterized protein LOC108215333 isoform X2 [Daucus carota subsp. sativus]WOG95001.1 hypothetical protein DCAR_0314303 [Daucus carota subsp. sativus]